MASSSKNAKAVGIDLGTDTSAAAWVDETGRSFLLRCDAGDGFIPSAVYFDETTILIGRAALAVYAPEADRLAVAVQRELGSPVYSKPILGRSLPPEVIQACLLRRIKADILASIGPGAKVVLTIPAAEDERRRKAAVDAGGLAGLPLFGIIDEGSAAAIGYDEVVGPPPTDNPEFRVPRTVFVYDLGGGTFKATFLRMTPSGYLPLAFGDDRRVGGCDWDERIFHLAIESCLAQCGRDPRADAAVAASLRAQCREAKHVLSVEENASIRVAFGDRTFESSLTRERFQAATESLLDRTIAVTEEARRRAGISWAEVDRVLPAGGASRMPAVARRLRELTGRTPEHTSIPDELAVRGSALFANYLVLIGGAAGLFPAGTARNEPAPSTGNAGAATQRNVLADDNADDDTGPLPFVPPSSRHDDAVASASSSAASPLVAPPIIHRGNAPLRSQKTGFGIRRRRERIRRLIAETLRLSKLQPIALGVSAAAGFTIAYLLLSRFFPGLSLPRFW